MGDCDGQGDRAGLLKGAAEILDKVGANVFLDAGNSNWLPTDEVARRVAVIGTKHLAGISLNVSNYNSTEAESAYGDLIAEQTGIPYVIDTSRNGNGGTGEWCNLPGQAIGETPRVVDQGNFAVMLWIKRPGESDGTCSGGPPTGSWSLANALELARNAAANGRSVTVVWDSPESPQAHAVILVRRARVELLGAEPVRHVQFQERLVTRPL